MARSTLSDRIDAIVKEQTIIDDRPHMQAINAWMEEHKRVDPRVNKNIKTCVEFVDDLLVDVRKMRLANDKIRKRLKLDPLTLAPNDDDE